jgi:hypothetical protein
MKPVCLCERFSQWFIKHYIKGWLLGLLLLLLVMGLCAWIFNTIGYDLLKDSKGMEVIHSSGKLVEKEISAVAEYEAFLSILSLFISSLVAWIVWRQSSIIAKQTEAQAKQLKTQAHLAEAEFITHIDQEWCSAEMTAVRAELWGKYFKAQKMNASEALQMEEVQNHIIKIEENARKSPTKKNMAHLFRLLNFLELLGTIYILREKAPIKDPILKEIFGGRLKKYLEFYEQYFKVHSENKTNAERLLKHMKDIKNQE